MNFNEYVKFLNDVLKLSVLKPPIRKKKIKAEDMKL